MGLFKSYYDIGRKDPAHKFLQELKKDKGYYVETRRKNQEMIDGAVSAFHEGRPENIRSALANAPEINNYYYPNLIPSVLHQLSKDNADGPGAIGRALEGIPEYRRQDFINQALNDALAHKIGGEAFFNLLLDAGADAKADVNGPSGLLAAAIGGAAPVAFIQRLYDSGADFDEALATLHSQGHKTEDVDRLEFYRKTLGAKSSAAKISGSGIEEDLRLALKTLQLIQEQIKELTEKVDRLSPQPPAANTNKPEKYPTQPLLRRPPPRL